MRTRGTMFGSWSLFGFAAASVLLCVSVSESAEESPEVLRYVQDLSAVSIPEPKVVDTRPETSCRAGSIAGAVCLPPDVFFGPHRRLASFRDISWVLGTAGLRADESVLVLGNDPVRRDAVAALLYLSGQSRVTVLDGPIDGLLSTGGSVQAAGRMRGILRDPIHTGSWREDRILLRNELAEALADGRIGQLLDGRTPDEYWGERIRARRGGHVPGAELAPAAQLRVARSRGGPGPDDHGGEAPVVAYAHDPLTGLAYLTLLRAGLGLDATLYLGGWREWADDGTLPVDAVSYAETGPTRAPRGSDAVAHGPPSPRAPESAWPHSLLTLAAVISAGSFGYLLGRRTS